MVTRNDDPPDDRDADRREALLEELAQLPLQGPFADFMNLIAEFFLKKMDEAYTEGYIDGSSDKAIKVYEEGSGT